MTTIAFTKVALPYGWLGNMAPYPVAVGGVLWRTTEALFQAWRFAEGDAVRDEILACPSPMGAKMIAKKNRERMVVEPQSATDLANMRTILTLKLVQHPLLGVWLKETSEADIVEDCSKRPRGSGLFWGAALQPDGSWKGENQLGRLWMELRKEHQGYQTDYVI